MPALTGLKMEERRRARGAMALTPRSAGIVESFFLAFVESSCLSMESVQTVEKQTDVLGRKLKA